MENAHLMWVISDRRGPQIMGMVHKAVREGNVKRLRKLLNGGLQRHCADPNEKPTTDGRYALHEAAERGALEATRLLLSKKANPHALDLEGSTPLHEAAARAHLEVAELLVMHRAEINTRDLAGHTRLYYAMRGSQLHVAEYLRRRGAEEA
jgi:uncharacterized protein